MGATIQFESHRVELPIVYELEHDASVLEYYDQPPSIQLHYAARDGRRLNVHHTADFFVLREDSAGWEECKTDLDLEKLAESAPNRYRRNGEGAWHCPPGESYASELGLYYRIRSSGSINWTLQQNLLFLEDYLRVGQPQVEQRNRQIIVEEIARQPGIRLSDLIERTKDAVTRDDIYFLVAAGEIFADATSALISRPEDVTLFANAGIASAFSHIDGSARDGEIKKELGAAINWDGKHWRIVNAGDHTVTFTDADGSFTELPNETFERLRAAGRFANSSGLAEFRASAATLLSQASVRELEEANRRFDLVKRYLNGEPVPVPDRTLRYWTSLYRAGQQEHGSGYLGLIPRIHSRGNRSNRLPQEVHTFAEEWIGKDYEALQQKTKYASWLGLKAECEIQGMVSPGYKTFCAWVDRRPAFERVLKRRGQRAAYAVSAWRHELSRTTPRHGERPFEIGHIDHTELDIELVCSVTGRSLGRPWLTLLMDAFSRRALAFYLTFDPPSYRACMMIVRECVRRHARLPQILILDGGAEFQSVYFETLLARYECTKKTRPPAKARFGSVCERLFGTTNTQFVHNLRGNTQLTREVRQVTRSVDPKGLAVWTIGELHDRTCEYLYEVYDVLDHPALGQSPRQAFELGLKVSGTRLHRAIPYDRELLIATLPATSRGTATVSPGRGIKVNHIYYWSEIFREAGVENEAVPVRYDPHDVGTAYAFVRNQWVVCRSEYFAAFQGRSEKEILIASREIQKRQQDHASNRGLSARRLAEFLGSIGAEEELQQQRSRDRECAAIRAGGNSGEAEPAAAGLIANSTDAPALVMEPVSYGDF
jgi:transposase InsO family protein